MNFGLSSAIKLGKREGINPIIAEIKVYSPKYSDLLQGRDPIKILRAYESAGAVGISYITEPKYFKGNFELFRRICKGTDLPVLRKDFIRSKDEIERTAEAEASAVLLITRILGNKTAEFVDYALEHGLETLVEVHTKDDIRIANETKTPMIGINNRDILRLERDDETVELTEKLCRYVSDGIVRISESGITSIDDLKRVLRCVDAALIGTVFMKAENTEKVVKAFVEG